MFFENSFYIEESSTSGIKKTFSFSSATEGLTRKSCYQNLVLGYIGRFNFGDITEWNLTEICAISDLRLFVPFGAEDAASV